MPEPRHIHSEAAGVEVCGATPCGAPDFLRRHDALRVLSEPPDDQEFFPHKGYRLASTLDIVIVALNAKVAIVVNRFIASGRYFVRACRFHDVLCFHEICKFLCQTVEISGKN
jgi:hypothetical protein